jgi:hypothetical protein
MRKRERVAVRWACVIGALITWASLFVSWHRRFVFGWTDTDMLTDDGSDPSVERNVWHFGKIDGTIYSDQISMSEGRGDYRPLGRQGK